MEREIKIELGTSLDEVMYILGVYREKGESVWCLFNDYKLTSNDSLNEVYIKIFGFDKKTYDVKIKEYERGYVLEKEERELALQYNIPFWIREGKKIIDSCKYNEWESCVNSIANIDCYYLIIDDALDIMYELEAGSSLEDVKEIFISQEHSGNSAFIVKNIVYMFSKRGKEFYNMVSNLNVNNNAIVKKLIK